MTHDPRPWGLLLVGCDVGDREYWYWRTEMPTDTGESDPPPHPWLVESDDVHRIEALLASALPAAGAPSPAQDLDRPPADLPPELMGRWRRRRERLPLLAGHRVLTGPLSSRESEDAFSAELARLLLPDGFRRELLRQYEDNGQAPVPVRILPAQRCIGVPWELLPIQTSNPPQRLVEVADVSTVAPVLPRDSEPLAAPQSASTDPHGLPPLVLVDPAHAPGTGPGRVLDDEARADWQQRYPGNDDAAPSATASIGSPGIDRIWLSAALTTTPRSRFSYVGHVTATPGDDASTALMLSCGRDVFGHEDGFGHAGGPVLGVRPFSARDAVCGTVGAPQLIDDLSARQLQEWFGVTQAADIRVPAAAMDADGQIAERHGDQLWPMPRRVALVACYSGPDLASPEPFGLVTAFLRAGAHLVTASRWALLTDVTFAAYARARGETGADRPFNEAALRIDEIQAGSGDPIAALCAWQRRKLDAWRSHGLLADSPLTWAAFTTYDGRERRVQLPPPPQEA